MRHANVDFEQLTQRQLAEAHAVTERTIRSWTAYGMPRQANGRYSLADTVRWRARQYFDSRGWLVPGWPERAPVRRVTDPAATGARVLEALDAGRARAIERQLKADP